jgi:hypothetical protein
VCIQFNTNTELRSYEELLRYKRRNAEEEDLAGIVKTSIKPYKTIPSSFINQPVSWVAPMGRCHDQNDHMCSSAGR